MVLRLLALWATLFVFFVLQSSSLGAQGEMLGKLLQFGYLKQTDGNTREGQPTPEEITEALIKFQKFNGLQETGTYNKRTRKLLNSRRCGNKDVFYENGTYGPYSFNAVIRWHKKELTWNLIKFSQTQRLSHEDQLRAIQTGLEHWSNVTDLTFKKVSGIADIMISFDRNNHGDNNPFDGSGGVLAHAFFPGRFDINGDAHFDDAELWTQYTPEGTNLEIVAAHEFGHALGLGHSMVSDSLMAPYYRGYIPNFKLHPDDIAGIQRLYGLKKVPTTTTEPTTTTTQPTTKTTTEPTTPTTQKTTEPTTPTTEPTTHKLTTILKPRTTTEKKLPISFCNRPANSKIKAAFTDPEGFVYIFLDTGLMISNKTGSHKINELFPEGPSLVDAAAFSKDYNELYLYSGVYMSVYKFDVSSHRFYRSEKSMTKLDIKVDAATVVTDNYGWERIFLFTGEYMYEYHPYFETVGERVGIEHMWYGAPTNYDAILTSENGINFIHGDRYTVVDRQLHVVLRVPEPIDVLFNCS